MIIDKYHKIIYNYTIKIYRRNSQEYLQLHSLIIIDENHKNIYN